MDGLSGGGAPLLGGGEEEEIIVEGMLNYKGMKAIRSETGGWRSAGFVMGVEIGERIAFYGISANLITYLTGSLHQSIAIAAVNINTWSGVVSLLPLLGAFVADSYLGRYRTILFASILYVMGLGLITLSALLTTSSLKHCQDINNNSCPTITFQVTLFFFLLYIVAIAHGGHKACTQAFGADQFNSQDSHESKSRSSFFNWWFFGICSLDIISFTIFTYIEDNISWALGFGLSCISMGIAVIVFVFGTKTYRYSLKDDESNPYMKIGLVFVHAVKNWRSSLPASSKEAVNGRPHQFKFLDKALMDVSDNEDRNVCSASQVNDAKQMLRLIQIWFTCLAYGVVFAQATTFFTKQGSTMERSLGSSFKVPPASLMSFMSLSIILFIPIYDRAIVPIARAFKNRPSGITMLQRIGFGMILSVIAMVVAALVELKRLKVARDFGLIDDVPGTVVPMSIWWLLPQYCLMGISNIFTIVGLQEFFYDQVPNGMRSLGIALYWSMLGVGSFLSGFLISIIEKFSGNGGGDGWFSNNLNQGHLDHFYWLLAGLSAIGFVIYLHFARSYVCNRQNNT